METKILELRQKISDEENRFYSLKTKPAKQKSRDKLWVLRGELDGLLLDVAHEFNCINSDKAIIGEVVCTTRDGALVKTELGMFDIYNSNSPLSASWYSETSCITYVKGEKITLKIEAEVYDERLFYTAVKVLSGGQFDAARYEKLSQQKNLAFFRYNLNSKNVTGLFA